MSKGLLVNYYGYRNLGDELLVFWMIDYIFEHYPVDHLVIAAWDPVFLNQRLDKSVHLLWDKRTKIKIHAKKIWYVWTYRYLAYKKFFWWGEVFSERRGFYGGWNSALRYFPDIVRKNFTLFGGIETPKASRQKLLYKLVLPRAKAIVTRDKTSFATAKKYNSKAVLFQDFAKNLIDQLAKNTKKTTKKPYILINLHPQRSGKKDIQKVITFTSQYPDHDCYYVRCWCDDKPLINKLKKHIPHIQQYDRDCHTVEEIISFFANATAWIGARLHFLMLLKECNVPLEAIVYAEKVKKLILND